VTASKVVAAFAAVSEATVVAGFVLLAGLAAVTDVTAVAAFARVLANSRERATLSVGAQVADCLLVC